MTVFQPSTRLRSSVIDPHQRVNYVLGMVLGVDDFVQESTWHTETLRQVVRDLIGYGTVRGLMVSQRATEDGPEVVVEPGVAITPRGEIARVPAQQCALINEWLESGGLTDEDKKRAHREAVDDAVQSTGPDVGTLRIHVVLDFAECTTAPRPIPGEPCRSEDDVLVDSRIKDGFALSLQLHSPQQIELAGMQGLFEWIAKIPVDDIPVNPDDLTAFLGALRAAAKTSPAGPPFMSSPPPSALRIPRAAVSQWLRAAVRVYITELRSDPAWLAPGQNAIGDAPSRVGTADAPSGVLLAALDLSVVSTSSSVGAVWTVGSESDAVSIDDSERPLLLPTQALGTASLVVGQVMALALGGP